MREKKRKRIHTETAETYGLYPYLLPLAALRHEIQEMSFKFEITSEFFRTKPVENTTHWVKYAQ